MTLRKFHQNHVFSTLLVLIILTLGMISYQLIPKEKSPHVAFHWLVIQASLPGADAATIESKLATPIESMVHAIPDVAFSISTSRDNITDVLVRFDNLSSLEYLKHFNSLKSQLQSLDKESYHNLDIIEINSANTFPTATIVLSSPEINQSFTEQVAHLEQRLKSIKGVYKVALLGAYKPYTDLNIESTTLGNTGLSSMELQGLLQAQLQQKLVGHVQQGGVQNSVSLENQINENTLLPTKQGPMPLGNVVSFESGFDSGPIKAGYKQQAAVVFSILKQPNTNEIELMNAIKTTLAHTKLSSEQTLELLDDQSHVTQAALNVMLSNAGIGLILVLLTVGILIGFRFALLMILAIPVIFALTLISLYWMGQTLNITVLLGLVIVLGMVVDDSVVILDAIAYHFRKCKRMSQAISEAFKEVAVPVICTVLTTCATFLPLMLLPGILGQFMFVLPLVVILSLAFSLVEGFGLMPSHISALSAHLSDSRLSSLRSKSLAKLTRFYLRTLIACLRKPSIIGLLVIVLTVVVAGALVKGKIKIDFFALEPSKVFYINLDMPAGTNLESTFDTIETVAKNLQVPHSYYAGIQFQDTGVSYGSDKAQIFVSLDNQMTQSEIEPLIQQLKQTLTVPAGILSIQVINDGPPLSDTLDVKLTSANRLALNQANDALLSKLRNTALTLSGERETQVPQYRFALKHKAILQAGLVPSDVLHQLQLLFYPITLHETIEDGQTHLYRLKQAHFQSVEGLDSISIVGADGKRYLLSDFVTTTTVTSPNQLQHYNGLAMSELKWTYGDMSATEAAAAVEHAWDAISADYPSVYLSFHGLLDDIKQTVAMLPWIMLLGLALVYLVLATQFNSFIQPLVVFVTTPLAVLGVLIGLLLSGYPLSVYALYGTVALIGIAVNGAILIISAANSRARDLGKSKAIIWAAKRRFVPILVSTVTTIAGLSALCFGWGGQSLLWGPLAGAIVYGLGFSTLLTLYCIPILYAWKRP